MTGSNILNDIEIEVDRDGETRAYKVDIVISWYHTPGRMYERNGDPGSPEEFDYDFNIIHAYEITDEGDVEIGSEYFDDFYSEVTDYLKELDIEKIKG